MANMNRFNILVRYNDILLEPLRYTDMLFVQSKKWFFINQLL